MRQTKPAGGGEPADNMQILREKLKADKKLVVAANMALTEAEAKAFWPLYEEYQKGLHQINDRHGDASRRVREGVQHQQPDRREGESAAGPIPRRSRRRRSS